MHHIPRATESLGSTSTTATTPPHHASGSQGFSSTSRVVIGSICVCFGVAILIREYSDLGKSLPSSLSGIPQVLGVFLYSRRRRRRRHKHSVKDPGIVFDRDVFAKKPTSAVELDKYMMADLAKPVRPQFYRESSSSTSTFDDSILRRQPQSNSPFNADEDEEMATPILAFPKPLAEKKPRTPRSKPTWLSPITTGEEVSSPPLAYGMSSLEREIFSQRPLRTTLMPTTPPSRKSRASLKSITSSQSLIIPDFEPMPVISPARSESFAPKDLDLPTSPHTPPAIFTFGLDSAAGQIGSSRVEHDKDVGLPSRLMTVVALYTPNLADELQVKLGDVVRIIAEYKDGWCFAQLLGTIDAPKGVVPLVCLQAAFAQTHRGSNKSLTTLNWRCND